MGYRSIYAIKKSLSDYQLTILLYLSHGCRIVTNEGKSFRAWLEYNGNHQEGLPVRKDTGDKLLTDGLIMQVDGGHNHLFYYAITFKGLQILSMVDEGVKHRLSGKIRVNG